MMNFAQKVLFFMGRERFGGFAGEWDPLGTTTLVIIPIRFPEIDLPMRENEPKVNRRMSRGSVN